MEIWEHSKGQYKWNKASEIFGISINYIYTDGRIEHKLIFFFFKLRIKMVGAPGSFSQ